MKKLSSTEAELKKKKKSVAYKKRVFIQNVSNRLYLEASFV